MDSFALHDSAVLLTAGLGFAVLRVLLLVLLPMLPFAITAQSVDRISTRRPALSPLLEWAAAGTGVLAAPLLLWACDFVPLLDLHEVFRPGGPWDLDFRGFLEFRAAPLLVAPWRLATALAAGDAGPDIYRGSVLVSLATASLVLGPALLVRSRIGLASALRNLVLFAWGAYATTYTVACLLWLANMLNFWCFLVLFGASLLRRN